MKARLVRILLAAFLGLAFAHHVQAHQDTHEHECLTASSDPLVAFNENSFKYHALTCIWARRCTVNCVTVRKSEAEARGGVPCKVCKGGESDGAQHGHQDR